MFMSILEWFVRNSSITVIGNNKYYSRCEMDPLPTEIYQEIIDFQTDVNRPLDLSIYREFNTESA